MQAFCETITAQASEGSSITETVTVNIQSSTSSDVLITCALQQVNQQGASGQVQIAITTYVQNGETHQGSWPVVIGSNITSASVALTANSARATATALVIY